jgi:hypothetical protein
MESLEALEEYEFTDESTGMSQTDKNDVSICIDCFIFDGFISRQFTMRGNCGM